MLACYSCSSDTSFHIVTIEHRGEALNQNRFYDDAVHRESAGLDLTIIFTLKNRLSRSHKQAPERSTANCYWRGFYQLTQLDTNEYENKYISNVERINKHFYSPPRYS